jgi:carbon storage regulator
MPPGFPPEWRKSGDTSLEEHAMLVLSRKLGQRFQVGPDVRITIVKIDKNSVRIGIEAPGEVTVYREEIAPDGHERPIPFRADAA